jgi:hypothetical protein
MQIAAQFVASNRKVFNYADSVFHYALKFAAHLVAQFHFDAAFELVSDFQSRLQRLGIGVNAMSFGGNISRDDGNAGDNSRAAVYFAARYRRKTVCRCRHLTQLFAFCACNANRIKIHWVMLLKKLLENWQGNRNSKTAAFDLGIPLPTFRKYRNGKRTPSSLAMAELKRRMESTK